MKERLSLSIIIPAYNESKRIDVTLDSVEAYCQNKNFEYEIIVVNDGSKDNTKEAVLIRSWGKSHIRLVDYPENKGKGYAVRLGMQEAQGDLRLFMDADNSVSISNLDRFLNYLDKGYDIVIASIALDGSDIIEHSGWHRRVLGNLAHFLINLVAAPGVKDSQRGFKLFTRRAAETIFRQQTLERFGFDFEILTIARKKGFRVKELPVQWSNPPGSKVGLFSYLNTLKELLKVRSNLLQGKYD